MSKDRISITLPVTHVEWLNEQSKERETGKSELVEAAIDAMMCVDKAVVATPPHEGELKELRAAIECLAHRYMMDHPTDGKTADERLIAYRALYTKVAKTY